MRYFVLFLMLIGTLHLNGQCLSGNCKNGVGEFQTSNTSRYKGEFKYGQFHGKGTIKYNNGDVYQGAFNRGIKSGIGKYKFKDGNTYIGQFAEGQRHGKGKMLFVNGEEYRGSWINGQMHGDGEYKFKDGSIYVGQFSFGKMEGSGEMTTAEGNLVKGTWKANKYLNTKISNSKVSSQLKNCTNSYCHLEKGAFYYEDGSIFFGDFVDGKPNGEGKCEYINGDIYKGGWLNHAPHGEGIMYVSEGGEIAGIFENGRLIRRRYPAVSDDERPKAHLTTNAPEEGSQIYALVVGVASYNHLNTLKYTDDDAYHLYAFLKSPQGGALPDDQISLLIDEAATRTKIKTALDIITKKADSDDVILVYLSGHGLNGAYVPYDFDGSNNLLSYQTILSSINASNAKNKLLITDACHSGSMYAARSGMDRQIENYYKALNNTRGGTALMTSSKDTEVSLEYSGMRQGIFSHFLIRGLKGEANRNSDGMVTLEELFSYISINVKHYTNGTQTPLLRGSVSPDMPVALVYDN